MQRTILNTIVSTNNYYILTELLQKLVYIRSSVFFSRCLVETSAQDVAFALGSRTVPGLSYHVLPSHNCNSQLTQVEDEVEVTLRLTVSQYVLVSRILVGLNDQILIPVGMLLSEICGLVSMGRPP
jgi:hypothetical protein